uniref:DUF834 domain-containing protein n=1 Tax=Oryza nivara TaxID=4536 RepID=A0A0E0HBY3_ORYNI
MELSGERGINDGAQRLDLEKNSSISLLGAQILGPRGEDVGPTARPDSRHSSRDSDEVVVTALRARFGAPVGMMAFPMIRCMREGEERGGYDGNRTSTTNGNASFPVADDGEEGEEDEMELSALVPCCGVKTDGRRRC